ncbi:MAG: hypothetical protein AABX79_00060 [Nanoarchaeota archaeon]
MVYKNGPYLFENLGQRGSFISNGYLVTLQLDNLVTMGSKAIKVKEENYNWLLKKASDIQKKVGKPVSFDEALTEIKKMLDQK